MKWKDVRFRDRYLIVAESKTAAGEGRLISMNDELTALLTAHAERHISQFGFLDPEHYLFPKRRPAPGRPNATRQIVPKDLGENLSTRWH